MLIHRTEFISVIQANLSRRSATLFRYSKLSNKPRLRDSRTYAIPEGKPLQAPSSS